MKLIEENFKPSGNGSWKLNIIESEVKSSLKIDHLK